MTKVTIEIKYKGCDTFFNGAKLADLLYAIDDGQIDGTVEVIKIEENSQD